MFNTPASVAAGHICDAACERLQAACAASPDNVTCATLSRRSGALTINSASNCFNGTAGEVGAAERTPSDLAYGVTAESSAASGAFTVTVKGTVAASYSMSVKMGGVHVTGSPYTLIVKAASLDPKKIWTSGPALSVAEAGRTAQFTLRVRDAHSNHLPSSVTDVAGFLSGPSWQHYHDLGLISKPLRRLE